MIGKSVAGIYAKLHLTKLETTLKEINLNYFVKKFNFNFF
jgi:hypothetical protein